MLRSLLALAATSALAAPLQAQAAAAAPAAGAIVAAPITPHSATSAVASARILTLAWTDVKLPNRLLESAGRQAPRTGNRRFTLAWEPLAEVPRAVVLQTQPGATPCTRVELVAIPCR